MKKNNLISAFDEIKPDIYMKERLREKVITEKPAKNKLFKPAIAIIMTTICLVSALHFSGNNEKPVANESGITITENIVNLFTIKAYASDKNELLNDTESVTLTKEPTTFTDSKIERGNLTQYINENGEAKYAYNISYYGGSFVMQVVGENIKAVTFSSATNELISINSALRHNLEETDEYYTAKFTLPIQTLSAQNSLEDFQRLWNNGTLDEYKEKYFKEISTDLYNYNISIELLDDGSWNIYFVSKETASSVMQKSKTVTIEAQGNSKVDCKAIWQPQKALEKAMEYPAIDYDKLPKDTVTVTTEFADGEVQKQIYEMSFDEDGYLVVREIA